MNSGKNFEIQWKHSSPGYVLVYRLPDFAQSFGARNNNLRFTIKNPFDYLMWDSKRKVLFAIELKSVKGKAISFDKEKNGTGLIRFHQIKGLNEWNNYDGIKCGFLIEFREIERTVFIDIDSFLSLISQLEKKSFSFDDLSKYNIKHFIVPQKKLKVNYRYDVESFLSSFDNNGG